jgi:hypothetical protein
LAQTTQGQADMAGINPSGKRMRTKTPAAATEDPPFVLSNPLVLELLSTDGLPALPDDARRHCVHYTMTRVRQKGAVQPRQLTRQKFWEILKLCFLEAYPDATSKTKSILQFGLTAQEKHKDAARDEDKSIHYHCATFASEKYYWRRIRQIAWKKHQIQLNAVAHDGYSTMYRYLKCPTTKKPLHELDPQAYASPLHPKGDELKELLEVGEKLRNARASKRKLEPAAEAKPEVKSLFGAAFNWIVDNNLHGSAGALQFQADATTELQAGRPRLLEFVRKHRNDLADQIAFVWELLESPARLKRYQTERRELLLDAAAPALPDEAHMQQCANSSCKCDETYESILCFQDIDSVGFRHSVYDCLTAGREKGNALMIVGGKDCGKTTISQPVNAIFKCMPTPQSDSFCPLQNCRGYETFLWQDFRYNPGHPSKDDQGLRLDEGTWNRLLEGLPTLIGVAKTDGSRADFVFDEDVAFFFTGPFELTAFRNGRIDARETDQIATRIQYVRFDRPAPPRRGKAPKPCAFCWSRWVLAGQLQWMRDNAVACDEYFTRVEAMEAGIALPPALPIAAATVSGRVATPVVAPVAAASSVGPSPSPLDPQQMFEKLEKLMAWRSDGRLSESEFVAAKRALGLS